MAPKTLRILIVDDSHVIRRRLASMVAGMEGMEVIAEAADGVQGLDLAVRETPDVVIADVRMPGMSGIDLLRELKTRPDPPTVVMLTNYPYPAYRKRCRELGADHFFDKSTEFEAALHVLRGMTGTHEA
ncbi:MAG: response regulator transcription factor [Gemmatimonadales bacterium]|jgi:DNA-binding NarL/FixJ family response regulator